MLNLANAHYLIETKYAARRTAVPMISVTKSGLYLNTAFGREFLGTNSKNKKSYYAQVLEYQNRKYLVVSEKAQNEFYALHYNEDSGIHSTTTKGFREVLGTEEATVRYKVAEPEKTDVVGVLAYELLPFVEDSIESNNISRK